MVLRLPKRDYSATHKPTTQEERIQDASFKDVDDICDYVLKFTIYQEEDM
jgi:hypothetical protein